MSSVLVTFDMRGKGRTMGPVAGGTEAISVRFHIEGSRSRFRHVIVEMSDGSELFFTSGRMFQDLWEAKLPKSALEKIEELAFEQVDPVSGNPVAWQLFNELHHEIAIATMQPIVTC